MTDTPHTKTFVEKVATEYREHRLYEELGPGSGMLNYVLDYSVDDLYLDAFDEFSQNPEFGAYLVRAFEGYSYGGNLFDDARTMHNETGENNAVVILAEAFAQYISALGLIRLSSNDQLIVKEAV